MKMGFSTMGKPKKIGSLIWNIWVGSDRRLTFRKPGSLDPQDERERDGRSGAADVDEVGEETVGRHIRQRLPGGHRFDVRRQVLEEDRRDDGVHGVVAIDADGPQQRDQEGIHQNAGQRVQGEDERREGRLHDVVDDPLPARSGSPRRPDDEEEQRAEREERLVDDRRHVVGQLDDEFSSVKNF